MIKICVSNEKGGCAKTTTAVNISAILAEREYKVLLIDSDLQSYSTYYNQMKNDFEKFGLYEVMFGLADINDVIKPTKFGYDLLGTTEKLFRAEEDLISRKILCEPYLNLFETMLKKIPNNKYDFVIVDCPSHNSYLLQNVQIACDNLIIPMIPDQYAPSSLTMKQKAITEIRRKYNPNLRILGSLIVQYEKNPLIMLYSSIMRKNDFFRFFSTNVRKNIDIKKALAYYEPVNIYNKRSKGNEDYQAVVDEIIERCKTNG